MKHLSLLVLTTLGVSACASGSWPSGANSSILSDTPDYFLVVDPTTGAMSEPVGPACRNPMADPRDGTRLTLVRSNAGFGDYQLVGQRRYGLEGNQLLRINCSDGRPVGATAGAP